MMSGSMLRPVTIDPAAAFHNSLAVPGRSKATFWAFGSCTGQVAAGKSDMQSYALQVNTMVFTIIETSISSLQEFLKRDFFLLYKTLAWQ